MAVGSESPIERFDRILYWQCHILRMLGMDGYDCRLEHSKLSAAAKLMAGLFMVISFYDVLVLFRDDLFGKSFVLSTICLGCIGWGRILGGFSHRDDLPRLMHMARDTYLLANLHDIFRHGVMLYTLLFLEYCRLGCTYPSSIRTVPAAQLLPVERAYSPQAIVEVLSLTFHLVMTLYVMRTSIWLPGLFLIPLCTIQLLIFCIPGTLIELKASKLTARDAPAEQANRSPTAALQPASEWAYLLTSI
uniref:Uncharacterized protein n=1 Tax=Anopheles coluzzii TaxID=1518534 RepID=A0A6E8W786_ANOCL